MMSRWLKRKAWQWDAYERTGGWERDEALMVKVLIVVMTVTAVVWGCCGRMG